jgi:signal peptidase I
MVQEMAEPRSKLAIILIAIFPGIISLMLFLGRAWLAGVYAGVLILWAAVAILFARSANTSLMKAGLDLETLLLIVALVPTLVALIHALIIRRASLSRPLYSRWFISLIAAPLLVFLLLACFRSFAYQPFTAASTSMHPTLAIGDYFFASKWPYGWNRYSLPWNVFSGRGSVLPMEPERGDVIVHKVLDDERVDYTMRVIGLSGERVRVAGGAVYINGTAVKKERIEDYIEPVAFTALPQFRETLPNGVSYRVLDLEPNGPLDNTQEFLVPAGHYFMLGDHRDHSVDSRDEDIGFIPHDYLMGRVELIYWNALAAPIDGRLGGNP